MAFTTESLAPTAIPSKTNEPNQFDLPDKVFTGYDPKGTASVTGSPIVHKEQASKPGEAPAPKVPEESVALSPKVSALARKEQAQRQREAAIAKREKDLEAKLADAEKYQALKAKIAAKDYTAADELGVEYQEIVKHELNKEAAKDPAQERVRQLEEKLAALQKAQEESTVKEYQANQTYGNKKFPK